jgi:hypothetical protein
MICGSLLRPASEIGPLSIDQSQVTIDELLLNAGISSARTHIVEAALTCRRASR